MLHYSPKTQSGHIPTRFPTLSISSCNLSACLPWGLSKVWAAGFPQEGWRLWSLCVSCLRQKIWALLWANSATKTSLALQACCCSGNLKPPISNVITSWLSLLLHQGGYFVNLEKAKNIEIDFFFTRLSPYTLKETTFLSVWLLWDISPDGKCMKSFLSASKHFLLKEKRWLPFLSHHLELAWKLV